MHEVEGSSYGRVVANELMNSNTSGSGSRRSTNTSSSGSNRITRTSGSGSSRRGNTNGSGSSGRRRTIHESEEHSCGKGDIV